MSKEGKMEKSFLNFKAAHPDWTPNDPSGSLYLSRMADLSAAHPNAITRRRLLQRAPELGFQGDGGAVAREAEAPFEEVS